jgi:hypothetical protein
MIGAAKARDRMGAQNRIEHGQRHPLAVVET